MRLRRSPACATPVSSVALTTGFSGTTQEKLIAALGWQSLADLVLAPGNGVRGRPFPDLLLTALMRLEIDGVHNVAALGDTSSDVKVRCGPAPPSPRARSPAPTTRSSCTTPGPPTSSVGVTEFADLILHDR